MVPSELVALTWAACHGDTAGKPLAGLAACLAQSLRRITLDSSVLSTTTKLLAVPCRQGSARPANHHLAHSDLELQLLAVWWCWVCQPSCSGSSIWLGSISQLVAVSMGGHVIEIPLLQMTW